MRIRGELVTHRLVSSGIPWLRAWFGSSLLPMTPTQKKSQSVLHMPFAPAPRSSARHWRLCLPSKAACLSQSAWRESLFTFDPFPACSISRDLWNEDARGCCRKSNKKMKWEISSSACIVFVQSLTPVTQHIFFKTPVVRTSTPYSSIS